MLVLDNVHFFNGFHCDLIVVVVVLIVIIVQHCLLSLQSLTGAGGAIETAAAAAGPV